MDTDGQIEFYVFTHKYKPQYISCSRDRASLMYFFKCNQQDATLYNILYYCQCSSRFRRVLRPSSGAQKLYTQLSCCYR